MPYVNNKGVEIYYEIEGTGLDLILAHGFSSASEDWRELDYVAQLREQHRLIMVDARGHGRSGKPHDQTSYSHLARMTDYTAVLDALQVAKAHYWGFSMGGAVGFCLAKYAPDRFSSIIIGGLDPYPGSKDIGNRSLPTLKPIRGLPESGDPILTTLEGGGEAWLQFWERNMEVPEGMAKRLRSNDFLALIAQWKAPSEWREDIGPLLASFPLPCLLYVGDAEHDYAGMKYCANEMPRAEFVELSESNHFDAWAHSDEIAPQVKQFLENVEQP